MINEIITKVAQAQSNIFQELAKQQTSELSTIISLALKESQKSSVETIVDTFKRLQENNIQVNFPVYQAMPQEKGRSSTRKGKKFAITEPSTQRKTTILMNRFCAAANLIFKNQSKPR